jgi:peptidylprolyl isomerase
MEAATVCEGDIAVIEYKAAVSDGSQGVVASQNGTLRLRAGDCGAIGGVDKSVVGMSVGEMKNLVVPPERAFGLRDPALQKGVPRNRFSSYPALKAGSLLRIRSRSGKQIEVVAREVNDDIVTIDANHPLAGMTLTIEFTILNVEKACS